jgi:hypothetical protein
MECIWSTKEAFPGLWLAFPKDGTGFFKDGEAFRDFCGSNRKMKKTFHFVPKIL